MARVLIVSLVWLAAVGCGVLAVVMHGAWWVLAAFVAALAVVGTIIYKIATFRVAVPKIVPRKPLADCTKRVEVEGLWVDPLALRCGRVGEKGSRLSCLRILKAPGFEQVKTCFDPATIGQAQ